MLENQYLNNSFIVNVDHDVLYGLKNKYFRVCK